MKPKNGDKAIDNRLPLDRSISAIVAGMGLTSFLIWSIVLVLLVIVNIIYWSGFPYEVEGGSTETGIFEGYLHMFFILFLTFMTLYSLIFGGSGLLSFIGGLVYLRKKRMKILIITIIFNIIILSILFFINFIYIVVFISPDLLPISILFLGVLLIPFLVRFILTMIIIFLKFSYKG